ncbi:MAG: sugar ABC transporter permease [Actinomycetota bacterium]|nr:sugar ABC transporter permease [Actinomycetota bacterium]
MASTANTGPQPGRGGRPSPFRRDREGVAAGLFLLPNLIGFLIFTAIPVGAAFALAFYDYDLLLGASFAGLENFRELLSDEVFRAAFYNTVYFTVVSVPLSVVLGLATAMLVNQALRGVVVFRSIFLLPYVTVTVALSLVWKWIYLPDVGLINSFLGIFGVDGPAWLTSSVWAMPGLIIMSVWKGFGYNMVLFLAGLQGIPEHLYDAAKVDGATSWRRFLHVTLPLLSPTTFFVVVISVISSFQVFDQALIMTGGGPGTATTTLVLYIYQRGFQSFEMGYAAAVALVLFAAVFVFTVIQFMFQRRWVTYD